MQPLKLSTLKEVKINLNLRRKLPANKPTSIHCILRYNNQKVVIYDIEKIEPRYWNANSQKARANQRNPDGFDLNEILESRKQTFELIFNEYIKKHMYYPDPTELKDLCLNALNKVVVDPIKPIQDLLTFFDLFIAESESGARLNHVNGKPMSSGTLTVYRTVRNVVEEFTSKKGYDLKFDSLQLQFYDDFVHYLKFTKHFSTNTLGKYIKTVKTVLREANEKGLTENIQYRSKRFKVLTEASDKIYLDRAELQKMVDLDLSDNFRLERARDLFIVGCWTGLRFSDYKDISPKSISGDFLRIMQIKTKIEVVIPIHADVRAIMSRYKDKTENSIPPTISNPKMNEYIKEVSLQAGIDGITETRFTKAGKTTVKKAAKHQLVTTHTARRSFATNMYLMGVPSLTIMAITGHKTETSFMKYIKITPEEHAKNMMLIWKSQTEGKQSNE